MERQSTKIPIHEFLPHREPMLMVDYIEEISADHVICSFEVSAGNLFLSEGILQEAGLVEHMAQTCSSIVGQTYYTTDYNPEVDERVVGFISSIKTLDIYLLPKQNACLKTLAKLMSRYDGEGYSICTMHVETQTEGIRCANAEINLFLQERNK